MMGDTQMNMMNDHQSYDDVRNIPPLPSNPMSIFGIPQVPMGMQGIPPPPGMGMEGHMDVNKDIMMFNSEGMPGVINMFPPIPQQNPLCSQPPMVPHTMNVQPTSIPLENSIDHYMAAEIASIIHTMSTSQLVYILASLKKFSKAAPSEARRFLINNPQLTYALLHSQFLLDEIDKTVLPLNKIDTEIAQINKLERTSHLEGSQANDHYSEDMAIEENINTTPSVPSTNQIPPTSTSLSEEYDPYQFNDPDVIGFRPNVQPIVTSAKVETPPRGNIPSIEDLMSQGVHPASAVLVEEVLKNTEILTNIQRATLAEMESWPKEQKQQVLAIKVALHLRGIAVNL
ncbi:hypothetical protein BEWA_007530 [Theileria equi strain WA]|uniref:Cleavage stimulation factor subunit 2 hinge domain-containing protein n=1 Tax=Theileria equi strain WA TaxID=1537102 RepID=L0B2K4_THEEQ|nr:hypothetical protein BEWA_007530 [Theileria equi strain WA]AFZ81344.1 hypothetical protein BEWA_007530 [Theileria equi strain WA]|eukprot:XP_004831010.1 hypothetical protein BEWA_007530 [Theileria equi strain WA]